MPVLRSQRSKPSKQREDREMPPPVVTTPPRTRSTRSKKVSKKPVEETEYSEEPKSPTPSSSSSRSTRARTRTKVPHVVEKIEIASPPSTRSTRSTRQKTTVTKTAKSKENKKTVVKVEALNPFVHLSPLAVETKTRQAAKVPSKNGRGGAKKAKRPLVVSTSDELTTEESDMENAEKNLSLEQLHKQHLVPFTTAMGMCTEIPQCMAKLMDDTAAKKQEEKFQRLMRVTEMPPPLAPAPKMKAKGRQKRARSPENTPTTATKVPESFNFALKEESHVPAKKKMIMDQPTPEKEISTVTVEEVDSSKSIDVALKITDSKNMSENKEASAIISIKAIEEEKNSNGQEDVAVFGEKQEISKKIGKEKKLKKNQDNVVNDSSGFEMKEKKQASKADKKQKKAKKDNDKLEVQISSPSLSDPKPDSETDKKEKEDDTNFKEANQPKETNLIDTKKISVSVSSPVEKEEDNENIPIENVEEDIFEQSTVGITDDNATTAIAEITTETKENALGTDKTQILEVDNEVLETDIVLVKPPKNNIPLDATYVFETPKDKEQKANTTFTPELFTDTPKSRVADQTIVISKHGDNKEIKQGSEGLAVSSRESDSESNVNSAATSSATGKVSSLVNFFDKSKKDAESSKKGNTINCSKIAYDELEKTHIISPDHHDSINKPKPQCKDLNSTYVLPTKEKTSSSMMNVTVCVNKKELPAEFEVPSKQEKQLLKLIVPPSSSDFLQQGSRFMHDSPASRTFVKEPPSLAVVVEEDDDGKESVKSNKKSENARPLASVIKPAQKEKTKEKTVSTSSSSSSNASMKSATSQPCLLSSKKFATSGIKNGPNYGSTGKLHEVHKSKPLEEAEKRRKEFLEQKKEISKKKNAEWTKKTEKVKLEEEKKLKEKQKVAPTIAPLVPTSSILKKPAPMTFAKAPFEGAMGGLGFTKPKFNFGPSSKMTGPSVPPLSKTPFHKPAIPPPPIDVDMDDSFKSAQNLSSFLDQTTEGHLSSYDITMYEDLDEDLKHRENKTVPNWASDKEALKVALFSMVLLPEYENRLSGGFPKPDKNYKLFPNRRF